MRWLVSTLIFSLAVFGCDGGHDHDHDHGDDSHVGEGSHAGHHHEAPHDGTLVVLKEEFANLEFVLDSGTGSLACYALGPHAEQPQRLVQGEIRLSIEGLKSGNEREVLPLALLAHENELSGEKVGDSSEFRVTSDRLKGVTEFEAVVEAVTIRGQLFEAVRFRFPQGNE